MLPAHLPHGGVGHLFRGASLGQRESQVATSSHGMQTRSVGEACTRSVHKDTTRPASENRCSARRQCALAAAGRGRRVARMPGSFSRFPTTDALVSGCSFWCPRAGASSRGPCGQRGRSARVFFPTPMPEASGASWRRRTAASLTMPAAGATSPRASPDVRTRARCSPSCGGASSCGGPSTGVHGHRRFPKTKPPRGPRRRPGA